MDVASGTAEQAARSLERTKTTIDSVCSFWKRFDLDGKRHSLDQQGLRLTENQEASVASRRSLADRTKQFRRMDDAAKMGAGSRRQDAVDAKTGHLGHGLCLRFIAGKCQRGGRPQTFG